ncbi:hypothetical protein C8J33_1263 [Rhizobium sp. PP-CC-3G-465]|nr:hypothetical protein C8J33_1263 [Rhizobium sp. PP-CC-3G-465]
MRPRVGIGIALGRSEDLLNDKPAETMSYECNISRG